MGCGWAAGRLVHSLLLFLHIFPGVHQFHIHTNWLLLQLMLGCIFVGNITVFWKAGTDALALYPILKTGLFFPNPIAWREVRANGCAKFQAELWPAEPLWAWAALPGMRLCQIAAMNLLPYQNPVVAAAAPLCALPLISILVWKRSSAVCWTVRTPLCSPSSLARRVHQFWFSLAPLI